MDDQNTSPRMIFRQEAQQHYARGHSQHGEVLRLAPVWLGRAYPLIIMFSAALLGFLVFGRMNDYAEGPAIVQIEGGARVTSSVTAIVAEVLVSRGQPVEAGQLLMRLEDDEQQKSVTLLEEELSIQIASHLSDHGNENARRSVASLRSQLANARQQLAMRHLVSPVSGVVSGIHTRPGQLIGAGQLAAVVMSPDASIGLIAALPGHFRPQLEVNQRARFEVAGYPHAYSPVTLTLVFDEVVGSADAIRYLGTAAANDLYLHGAIVLVEGIFDSDTFEVDRRIFSFSDGMHGTLQVRLRTLPIILNLLPGIRYIVEGRHHDFGD